MYQVTRWSVFDKLEKDPNLTFEQLKQIFPLADDEEIMHGIAEFGGDNYENNTTDRPSFNRG